VKLLIGVTARRLLALPINLLLFALEARQRPERIFITVKLSFRRSLKIWILVLVGLKYFTIRIYIKWEVLLLPYNWFDNCISYLNDLVDESGMFYDFEAFTRVYGIGRH
jgi:hypothetical protein